MYSLVSPLSATYTRIEAIEKVIYPPTETQIQFAMQPVTLIVDPTVLRAFQSDPSESEDPALWRALCDHKTRARIWVNPSITELQGETRVFIQKCIAEGEHSNGFPCKLTVFQAKIGSFQMALKFRQKIFYEDGASEIMAEIEGNNAMKTEHNQSIRYLFPRMYCCITLVNQLGLHWEAIGTEYLREIPRDLFTAKPELLAQCYNILSELHRRGFSHGDPHTRNFMLDSHGTVKLIDQYEIQPLPKDPTLKTSMS